MAAGDFNANGMTDIAIADSTATTTSVLLGNGACTFYSVSMLHQACVQ